MVRRPHRPEARSRRPQARRADLGSARRARQLSAPATHLRNPAMTIAANPTLHRWDSMTRLPFGRALFSRLIGFVVPYSGSLGAEVLVLQPGWGEIRMGPAASR